MKYLYAAALSLLVENASAASFDCTKATTPQEKAVCGSTTLSALDEKLADAYKNARTASQDPAKLKSEQVEWIKEARKCQSDTSCIERLYTARINELNPQPVKPTPEPVVAPSAVSASAVEQPASAPQPTASAMEAAPAAPVASAAAPLPAPAASEAKVVSVESKPSIFSDPVYQRYALIAGGGILALIAAYFAIKFLISFTKKAAAKASSAARAGVSKLSKEADNLKDGLSNKAQDISSQAKARASVLATDFSKEGGLKDQIKSMSQKTLDTVSKAGADLKHEAGNINNIRIATLQGGDTATKKPVYKRWWFWVCILALIGKIVETTEDPKIRACKDSAFSYYYNNKNFEEQLHRYDTDGGATLKSIILRLEDLYDLQYRGCEQK